MSKSSAIIVIGRSVKEFNGYIDSGGESVASIERPDATIGMEGVSLGPHGRHAVVPLHLESGGHELKRVQQARLGEGCQRLSRDEARETDGLQVTEVRDLGILCRCHRLGCRLSERKGECNIPLLLGSNYCLSKSSHIFPPVFLTNVS